MHIFFLKRKKGLTNTMPVNAEVKTHLLANFSCHLGYQPQGLQQVEHMSLIITWEGTLQCVKTGMWEVACL